MEFDFKNLLYIAFAILYFVFTSKKKGQGKKTDTPPSSPVGREESAPPVSTNRQPTFEDLLEQFTGERKKQEPKPFVIEDAKPQVFEEIQPTIKRKSIYSEANKLYGTKKRSDEAPISIFNEPEEELVETTDYAALVSDTDGARKAFVMGEIFNRKY
ncbi:hypothetical protein ACV07N_12360 [Roseivirga echinicomitans]